MTLQTLPRRLTAPYDMVEIDLASPFAPLELGAGSGGAHVLARLRGRPVGRFWIDRETHGARVLPATLREIAARSCGAAATAQGIEDALMAALDPDPAPTPSITLAVCTRDRARLLARTLEALLALRASRGEAASQVSVLVVDNAPPNAETRELVQALRAVSYVVEPAPGLDFARNRALAFCESEILAFIDDDAVPDSGWLEAVSSVARMSPRAVAFTGPVLPLVLETEAQLRFERAGGFGEGVLFDIFDAKRWGDRMHPINSGRMVTGANMAFRTEALRAVGGFDEALDTGPPLPGGGDLDILLRLAHAGGRIVYSPAQLVFHEHRRDMAALRRQHASWGLSVAALLRKTERAAPETRAQRGEFLYYWTRRSLRRLVASVRGRDAYPPSIHLAEAWGFVRGWFGEYERSLARVETRRRSVQGLPS